MTLEVEEILPAEQFHNELLKSFSEKEYVLVYNNQGVNHAAYVVKYNDKKKLVTCVNSRGPIDPSPRLALKDILNLYNSVSCSAVLAIKLKCKFLNFE